MLTENRHQMILDRLENQRTVSLQQLLNELNVSESTIRRDLSQLEEAGKLVRVHGGARRVYTLDSEPSFLEKASHHATEKEQIAAYAASLVNNRDIIYLDAGTTTLGMIPHLQNKQVVVITNGLQHAEKLSDLGLETILLGGKVKSRTRAMIGVEAIRQLGQYRFQKVFMGMNGVDVEYGFTTPDTEEAEVKRLAMAQGNQVYVLVDYDKIGKVSFCRVANIDDAIIVTNQLEPSVSAQLNQVTTVKEC